MSNKVKVQMLEPKEGIRTIDTTGGQTIAKPNVNGWASLSESMPEENETVWLTEIGTNSVSLGCRVYLKNEGWFWAFTNGNFYGEDGKIVTECELTDNDVFTHYHRVPSLPCR